MREQWHSTARSEIHRACNRKNEMCPRGFPPRAPQPSNRTVASSFMEGALCPQDESISCLSTAPSRKACLLHQTWLRIQFNSVVLYHSVTASEIHLHPMILCQYRSPPISLTLQVRCNIRRVHTAGAPFQTPWNSSYIGRRSCP